VLCLVRPGEGWSSCHATVLGEHRFFCFLLFSFSVRFIYFAGKDIRTRDILIPFLAKYTELTNLIYMSSSVCVSCDNTFSTRYRLVTHLKSVTLECGKTEAGRHQLSELEPVHRTKEKFYECKDCLRRFSTNGCLVRHRTNSHDASDKGEYEVEVEDGDVVVQNRDRDSARDREIQQLRERVDHLSTLVGCIHPSQITSNTINCNALNVLHINGLGREDLSRVTADVLTLCLKQLPNGNKGLLDLVKIIHNDTDGNMNVRCLAGDDKDLVMSYFDGDKNEWTIDSKKKVIDDMIKRPRSMLDDHFQTNVNDFEKGVTSALYNFVHAWLKNTRNKKHPVYDDSARRLHAMVKKWSAVITNELHNEHLEHGIGQPYV